MKNLILLFVFLQLFHSCQDKKLDWGQVQLPIALDSISKNYEVLPYYEYPNQKMDLYKSYDKDLLNFDGVGLAEKDIIDNSAILYVSKSSKKVVAVSLFTEDAKKTDALVKKLEEKLGPTDYHYYYKNDALPSRDRIWKKANNYYTLRLNDVAYIFDKKTKTAILTIFYASPDNPFVKWWFYEGGDFSGFYGQYLDEKSKPEHKNDNYTYKDFVEQMDRENKNFGTTSRDYVK